jgi:hypothetical protein
MWLLIMWHIPDLMFQIAPKKTNRILLDQESDVAKVSRHLYSYLSQGIVSDGVALLHCWYGKELHLAATT